jgi:hypothetical protein
MQRYETIEELMTEIKNKTLFEELQSLSINEFPLRNDKAVAPLGEPPTLLAVCRSCSNLCKQREVRGLMMFHCNVYSGEKEKAFHPEQPGV